VIVFVAFPEAEHGQEVKDGVEAQEGEDWDVEVDSGTGSRQKTLFFCNSYNFKICYFESSD
jgi:hypothetical protein